MLEVDTFLFTIHALIVIPLIIIKVFILKIFDE